MLKEPRCVWHFPWQDETYVWEGLLDADAYDEVEARECKSETYVLEGTMESTSGGVLRLGGHTLCAWSSSQKVVP